MICELIQLFDKEFIFVTCYLVNTLLYTVFIENKMDYI